MDKISLPTAFKDLSKAFEDLNKVLDLRLFGKSNVSEALQTLTNSVLIEDTKKIITAFLEKCNEISKPFKYINHSIILHVEKSRSYNASIKQVDYGSLYVPPIINYKSKNYIGKMEGKDIVFRK